MVALDEFTFGCGRESAQEIVGADVPHGHWQYLANAADQTAAEERRHLPIPAGDPIADIGGISREEFIGPLTLEHDLDLLSGKEGEQMGRDDGGIAERLVKTHRDPAQTIGEVVFGEDQLVEIGLEEPCGFAREA